MKYPPVTYQDYLQLDKILNAQVLRSETFKNKSHDELLFITVHQTYELWFKQILCEIESVIEIFQKAPVSENFLGLAQNRLERVISILTLISGQIDVLETMTPLDFLEFRDYLYPASGFQSFQFRVLESRLGLKLEDRLTYNQGPFYQFLTPEQQTEIKTILKSPSLFELVDAWLARTPFLQSEDFDFWSEYKLSVKRMFEADQEVVRTNPHLSEKDKARNLEIIQGSIETFNGLMDPDSFEKLREQNYFKMSYRAIHGAMLVQLYRDQSILQTPFKIIQSLMNIDEILTQWRYRHSLMAHRMLGRKIGTGGSSGSEYLKSATERHKVFSDFFNLSTFFIPRSELPALPKSLSQKMEFRN